jgi:DnaJ-class molecular chaperone
MIVSLDKAKKAASILGLQLPELTELQVARAFREMAKECHPDQHGYGKLEEWSNISWAKEVLTHWVKKHPADEGKAAIFKGGDCLNCLGTGRVKVRKSGFGIPLTVQCAACRGLGTIINEENDSDWG